MNFLQKLQIADSAMSGAGSAAVVGERGWGVTAAAAVSTAGGANGEEVTAEAATEELPLSRLDLRRQQQAATAASEAAKAASRSDFAARVAAEADAPPSAAAVAAGEAPPSAAAAEGSEAGLRYLKMMTPVAHRQTPGKIQRRTRRQQVAKAAHEVAEKAAAAEREAATFHQMALDSVEESERALAVAMVSASERALA